jgi:isoquinoline 1-oxidoreductase alpha subunit
MATLKINGEDRTYEAPDDTPLLWVIREELKLAGRFISFARLRAAQTPLLPACRLRTQPLSTAAGAATPAAWRC